MRATILLLSAAVMAGCASPGQLPTGGADGGGHDGGAIGQVDASQPGAADAAPAAVTWTTPTDPPDCDLGKPFAAPAPIPGWLRAVEGARLSPDELVILYGAPGTGTDSNSDLFQATRTDRHEAFGEPTLVASVDTDADETWPSVTADGLTLFFERSGAYGGIMEATRASVTDDFGAVTGIVKAFTPYVSADGATLYMAATIGNTDLVYRAARGGAGYAVPTAEPNVNDAGENWEPVITADGLSLYFARSVGGDPNGDEIYVAHRASVTAAFGTPTRDAELSSPTNDRPSWISPDGCRMYLIESSALVVATRPQ